MWSPTKSGLESRERARAAQDEGLGLDGRSKAIVLWAVAALPAAVILGPGGAWALGAADAAGGAALTGRRPAALTALLSALAIAGLSIPALAVLTPTPLLLALAVTALAAAASGPETFPWLRRGEWNAAVSLRVVAIVVVSGAALLLWHRLARPNVSDILARLPPVSGWWLAALVVGWACLNAVAEELVFRGAFQHALDAAFGVRIAILVQAAAFGLVHFRGFPRGWSGVLLAAIYGLMIGELRQRSRGLLAPWAAHVFADLTIMGIVVTLAR